MVNTISKIKQSFPKRRFDASSTTDLRVYKRFLETGGWGKEACPFELEWPWLTIPDMISHKISQAAVAKV